MHVAEVLNKQHFSVHPFQKGGLNLYMLIEPDFISASIFNADNSLLHEISSMQFSENKNYNENAIYELSFFLKDFDILKHTYKQVSVQILNRYFTLVPSAYSNGHLKEMLEFNLGLTGIQTVQTIVINNSIDFAFTYDLQLYSFIEKTFNTAKISHSGASSIDLFLKLSLFKNANVLLNVHSKLIELVIKNDNELLFYNVFKWDSNEDILYFLLFSIEQFQLNNNTLKLYVAANKASNSELFMLIKKYIRSVNFVNSKSIDIPVENLPNHYYFNILNKHLCEF